ncbi:MAG: type IVB secretion system protein IcmW [Francisellaceae bacterium]
MRQIVFTPEEVAQYWKNYKNMNINHALNNFEHLEDGIYACDEDHIAQLEKLYTQMGSDAGKEVELSALLKLMNALPAAYMFYLLHKVNDIKPDLASQLISQAKQKHDTDEEYRQFYHRNMLFERLQIASRIFSSERINRLIKALSE